MIHERFDLDRWKAMFPLVRLREQERVHARQHLEQGYARLPEPHTEADVERWLEHTTDWYIVAMSPSPNCAGMITSPCTIAAIEQLREERKDTLPIIGRVPTDVFVFGRGEATRRDVTKIGGLPYWPAGREWPRTAAGEPMTFVAQFNFADSQDIAGDLPGDVMLIFAELAYVTREGVERTPGAVWRATENRIPLPALSQMHFTWLPLGQDDLIRAQDVPLTDWRIMPCYGQIHRAEDWTFDDPDGDFEDNNHLWILNGTKIGGLPCEVQGDPRAYLPGRLLCTLAETSPDRGRQYPYVNVIEPLGDHIEEEQYALDWGDCGLVYIFIEDDGQIHYSIESH